MQKNIKLKALGQSASIGSFYDATTNNFDTMSIFKKDISDFITTIDDPTTVFEFDRTNSFTEKFKKFDINGSLKLKLLAGLFEFEGAANYLKEDLSDDGSQKMSIIYKCRTKKDSLNINEMGLVNNFALDNFHNYTHFVTSIKWGADIVITFEEKNYKKNKNTNAGLSGKAEVNIDKILSTIGLEVNVPIGKIDLKGGINYNDIEKKFDENIQIKINADIPGLDIIPVSMKELFELIKDIPSKLQNCNNGKGKPVEYELTPLFTIKQMFKLDSVQLSHFYNDLDNNSIDEIISDFDNYLNEKKKFNLFIDHCYLLKDYLKKKDFQEIESKKKNLNRKEMNFKKAIHENLVEIRKSQSKEEMNKLKDNFEKNVENFLDTANNIMENELRNEMEEKINFLFFLKDILNVKLLGSKESITHLLQTELLSFEKVYILLGQIEKRENEDWNETYRIFTNVLKKDKAKDQEEKRNEFFFAEWSFHKDLVDEFFKDKNCIIIVFTKGLKGYMGKISYPNGDVYEGEISKTGKINGYGTKTWNSDGELSQYEGEWKDEKRNGFGKCYFEDGTCYEGQWKDDEFNGKGKFFHKNNDVFVGFFRNGEADGEGTLFKNGNTIAHNIDYINGKA